ncbi:MAG: nuclear transport factor 2 family protein, partial [Gammaproteobacteria bacterium]
MADTLESLAARLRYLEDLEAVRQTWRDYCIRLDSKDWAGLGDVFTADAELEMIGLKGLGDGLDGVFNGRTNIVDEFYKPAMSGVYDIAGGIFTTGHISTNMQI